MLKKPPLTTFTVPVIYFCGYNKYWSLKKLQYINNWGKIAETAVVTAFLIYIPLYVYRRSGTSLCPSFKLGPRDRL